MLIEADFNTHLYQEVITAIERGTDGILEKSIKAAELQAKGYLSRYDIAALFAAVDPDRDEMLLMYLKDLAIWHFIVLANPSVNIDFHEMRYDQALKELGKIQSGKVVPFGWLPATTPEGGDTAFHISSQPRRETSL